MKTLNIFLCLMSILFLSGCSSDASSQSIKKCSGCNCKVGSACGCTEGKCNCAGGACHCSH